MKRFVMLADPATSSVYEGADVPIPSLEDVLFHQRLFDPDTAVDPVKNATWVAAPDPAIVAVPVVSVSAAQYHCDVDEFHLRT
jgi:hypothetical protein